MLATLNATVLPWLEAFALAFMPGALTLAYFDLIRPWAQRHKLNTTLLDAGAGAYAQAVASGVTVTSPGALAGLITATLANATGASPGAIKRLEPQTAAQLALQAIGKSIVLDPNTSIAPPALAVAVPNGGGAVGVATGGGAQQTATLAAMDEVPGKPADPFASVAGSLATALPSLPIASALTQVATASQASPLLQVLDAAGLAAAQLAQAQHTGQAP
jgi:hypothetical protein